MSCFSGTVRNVQTARCRWHIRQWAAPGLGSEPSAAVVDKASGRDQMQFQGSGLFKHQPLYFPVLAVFLTLLQLRTLLKSSLL